MFFCVHISLCYIFCVFSLHDFSSDMLSRSLISLYSLISSDPAPVAEMFQTLYGQTAAALYAKAAGQNAQARQLYNASADTYYKANDAAAYDDWVRARNHWDYFYNRS